MTICAFKDTGDSVTMRTVCMVVFSSLLCSALSAPLQVKEETKTMFFGEDFHIMLPSLNTEVLFRASSDPGTEVVLMRGDSVNPRAKLNSQSNHLILDGVAEVDEGVYTMKNSETPNFIQRITLIVRDCSNEQSVKYGDSYHLQLRGVEPPIMLQYRPSHVEANQTHRPAQTVLNQTGFAMDGYQGRVSANDQRVTLTAVTGADEGSYTVLDAHKHIQRKVCLKVLEHQNFVVLPYAGTLKINLLLNSSMVRVLYTPDYDRVSRPILEKGELQFPADLNLQGRLSLEDGVCVLEGVTARDIGHFKVTDLQDFPVSNVYLDVEPYKLPPVYVAIIALVGLLVFLLLVCLLSCLVKVKKRAKRAAALEKIAQDAGKHDEGDAFRQVVKDISIFNEDSKVNSVADNTEKSQSTEVDIKGLEVSSKEILDGANLETSDSGVEFNTSGLPLDTDTDAPDQIPDSEAVSISIATETKASPPRAPEPKPTPVPESKPSPPPEIKPTPVPESKPSPPPEIKLTPVPETKTSPPPVIKPSPVHETKESPEPPAEPKLTVTKPLDTEPSPEPKPAPDPVSKISPSGNASLESKTAEPKPTLTPSPESKPTTPKMTAPLPPEPKLAVPSTPEPLKPTTPEPAPTTNGTPEPAPESKPAQSPAPANLIGDSTPKATPPKTPEVEVTAAKEPPVELSSSGSALEAKVDDSSATVVDTTAATTTT